EYSIQSGKCGSVAMTLLMVHLTMSRWRVVPAIPLALALTRGSSKHELRVGVNPPASVQRVMISLQVLHCMKIPAASRFLEYFESAIDEPPWCAAFGFSLKPQSAAGRNDTGVKGFAGSHRPRTLESFASKPGKSSSQLWTNATLPECIIWNCPSHVEAVELGGAYFRSSWYHFRPATPCSSLPENFLSLAKIEPPWPTPPGSSRIPANSGRISPATQCRRCRFPFQL